MSATPDRQEEVLGKAYDAKLMRRVWQFVRPHWRLVVLALALVPITIGFELVQPRLLKRAIDVNIAHHDRDGLGVLALLYVGCVLLQALTGYAQLYALQLLGQRSMNDLRLAAYRHVISRRAGFYDHMPVGRLLTRLTNDIENINEMFASGVITLVADLAKLVAIVGMMLALDVHLTLVTFVSFPLLLVVVAWARRIMRTSFRAIRVKIAALNSFLQEHLSGIKVVQLFGRERVSATEFDRINADHRDAYTGANTADAGMYAIVEGIGIATAAGIAWVAGGRIASTGLTVGLVVAFIEYVNKFFIPVRDFSAKYTVMQQAMAATERVVALLETEEVDAPVTPDDGTRTGDDHAVVFTGVSFAYRPTEPVLQGVDLAVPRGATVAVVGATGSGKSTLIRLLARLYEPDAGSIVVDGRDLKSWPARDLRRHVTVISQDVFLFAGTVADNVRLGKPDASDDEVDRALAAVGADVMLSRRGASPSTVVAERGANFSAGERQLVAFARAMVRDPGILVLDEATAHVDPETEAAIERGLTALMHGRTTLVIAHRLSTIQHADHIVVMARGRIAEQGSRPDLLASRGLYAQLEATFLRAEQA